MKIAIIGFGNLGQFLAKTFVRQGHTVVAYSRSDHSVSARNLAVLFFSDLNDLAEEHPEVILLSTSIISTQSVLNSIPLNKLKRSTLIVDVLSVKEFPKNLMQEKLPNHFDILCSHPMFDSKIDDYGEGCNGLLFIYDKVRIGSEESRVSRCDKFLSIFKNEGCGMVEMSCAEHDVYAAETEFITHTIGRVLKTLTLESTPINTKGYQSLLDLVKNIAGYSFDFYCDLFMFNKNALKMFERLVLAFEELKQQLFVRLHDEVRRKPSRMCLDHHEIEVNYRNEAASSALATGLEATRFEEFLSTCESNASVSNIYDNSNLKIAIVGFGDFGQFLARTIVKQGYNVLAYSSSDYSGTAKELGVSFFSDAHDLCDKHPDVVLICTSILSTQKFLMSLPIQRLKRNTLFVDVLSVKEFPRNLFLQTLPLDFNILCTHPMFGPESGENGSNWNGRSFVYDKVRVGNEGSRASRCDCFLDIFSREGCKMVEMSCVDHDRYAARSQFITHTIARILEKLNLNSTAANPSGYETLLNLVANTCGNSFDLYYGLFMYNANALEQLEKLDFAFQSLKKQLFGRLHNVLHNQHL